MPILLCLLRAGYTQKKLLHFARDSKKEGKLKDVSFVLNDVKITNFGYGNKYGYTYGEEKASFWARVKGVFNDSRHFEPACSRQVISSSVCISIYCFSRHFECFLRRETE